MIPIDGRPILTAAGMRAAEQAHGDLAGLMQRAGIGIAEAARRLAAGAEVLVLCGPGNNGGDGYVAATILREWGHPVRLAASSEPRSDLARDAASRWPSEVELLEQVRPAPVLVDALFGTGLSRPLGREITDPLHRLESHARLSIAVDLPSGVATDDGAVLSEPPRFDLTLALGALKPSHLLQPAARYAGAVRLLDLGVAVESEMAALGRPNLPEPGPDSHKFTRGMVAVVGGRMAGAGEAAAVAAMGAGAGYVLLLTEGGGEPHALVRKLWTDDALNEERIGAVVIGPGLGRDDEARAKLAEAVASGRPLIIDGDALSLLDPDANRAAPVILTPHAGEFKTLFGAGEGSKVDLARAAAERSGAVVVFKGPDTVIAAPDGRVRVAGDASDWLSTAGTGDVLAGTCGALLAGGMNPFDAAAGAVWLNTRAARRLGRAFIADDLARELSRVR